jgi:hypothetical protein
MAAIRKNDVARMSGDLSDDGRLVRVLPLVVQGDLPDL